MKGGEARRNWSLAHHLREARRNRYFAQLWKIDPLFKPYAAAVLALATTPQMSPAERRRVYTQMATERRTKLLGRLSGTQVRPGMLRLLAKVEYQKFQEADWRTLLGACNDEEIRRELRQLEWISPVLVRQLEYVPESVRCAAILAILNGLAVSEAHWRQFAASMKDAPPGVSRSIAKSARKVCTVGSFWDFLFECIDGTWKPFALPESFFGSPMLTPLATAKEMRREGRTMKSCMGQLVRGVVAGWDAYFHWNGSVPASVQLVRTGDRWDVGQIAAYDDEQVNQRETARIMRAARDIIDRTAGACGGAASDPREAVVQDVCADARRMFSPRTVARVARQLRLIRGKSLPGSGSFCVIEGEHGYVQFMADEEGKQYWCEIQSHQFATEMEARLTDSVVSLIRGCGFRWPELDQNFGRYFSVATDDEVAKLASFALGMLNRIFDHAPGMRLKLETKLAEKGA